MNTKKIVANSRRRAQGRTLWELMITFQKYFTDRKKSNILGLLNAHRIPVAYQNFYTSAFIG